MNCGYLELLTGAQGEDVKAATRLARTIGDENSRPAIVALLSDPPNELNCKQVTISPIRSPVTDD